ncbi:MAG: ABC transporter ATP-binding protein [Clostridia bacterium]|nr:ABC transporter ATP-binding protein [Clostridia bacterium]
MENNVVIKLEHVSKTFKLFKSEKQRFISVFKRKPNYTEKLATNDVSFEIKKGETVAFFGKNGAGKSTLLKLITGVSYPSKGTISVEGRICALLELTTGFDAQFTGRENIYLRGRLLGFTKEEIKEIEADVVEFADIGEYIDQPVRNYSSGMKARLGFAINSHIKPEILIIDEALSVGDKVFRQKCQAKVKEITERENVTLLFVTHSAGAAKEFCTRGIVLQSGKMIYDGPIDNAIEAYEESIKPAVKPKAKAKPVEKK